MKTKALEYPKCLHRLATFQPKHEKTATLVRTLTPCNEPAGHNSDFHKTADGRTWSTRRVTNCLARAIAEVDKAMTRPAISQHVWLAGKEPAAPITRIECHCRRCKPANKEMP